MDPKTVWNRYFGHTGFRPGQETLIDGILFGRDVMGIMPTGGGKSVCYQIPALLLPGTTLAISPPISLMKDQVTALRESNISAVFLSSSYVGAALIVRVLRGSRDLRIRELGLEELSTFGLLKETSRGLVDQYIDRLVEQELLIEAAHSTLRTTHKAAAVLFLGEQVTMLTRTEPREEKKQKHQGEKRSSLSKPAQADSGLLAALKATRTRLAQEERVPAYIVFSNALLIDMAEKAPKTMEQFLEVSGVGEVKAFRYGTIFLQVISEYEQ